MNARNASREIGECALNQVDVNIEATLRFFLAGGACG